MLAANFRNGQRATAAANTLLKIKHARFGSIAGMPPRGTPAMAERALQQQAQAEAERVRRQQAEQERIAALEREAQRLREIEERRKARGE